MRCACPHCGSDVEITLRPVEAPAVPVERAEDWLAPCELADRLGIGEAHVRKLIGRGLRRGERGFERRGGRLFATVDAIEMLRAA